MTAPLPQNCRERFVQTATLSRQHIVESGNPEAPLVLMLHGFPEFWYSWRQQLTALADDFHVVAADLRGYGQTVKPAPKPENYEMKVLAADTQALLHTLTANDKKPRKVTLVGHDWGGLVAWATASLHPDSLDKLVAIDAPHPVAYLQSLKKHPKQLLKSWYIALFQVPGLFEWQFRRNPAANMAKMLRGMAVQKSAFPREEIAHYAEAMTDRHTLPCALAYYRALPRSMKNLEPLRAKVQAPTLVLWGAHDQALGTELVEACRSVVDAPFETQIFADAGHWLQQEKAVEVSEAIRQFAAR